MTKYELLNILYAERNRVEKNYTRPGWTLWAIGAAIVSMGWLAWSYAEQCQHWRYAIMTFYLLYFSGNMIDTLSMPFRSFPQIPIWTKRKGVSYLQVMLHIIAYLGFVIIQIFMIPSSFFPWIYWISFCFNIILLLLMSKFISMIYDGIVINEKQSEKIYLSFVVFVPAYLLCVLYMLQLSHDTIAIHLGAICYAIFFLLTLIPLGQKRIFAQIDRLISTVLYERDEVEEKEVLQELELYTIGLRFGKYLSQKYMKDYISRIADLMDCSKRLVHSLKTGNRAQTNLIIQEGQMIYQDLRALEWKSVSSIRTVYGSENADNSYQPILSASKVGVAVMDFWNKEISIKEIGEDELMTQVKSIYEQTIGRPEIQKLIDDESIWVYNIS